MQAFWLNFDKTIFKSENDTIYGTNNHLWRLKFYVILQSAVSMNWKNSAVEEGKRIPSQSKQREGHREKNNILFNNLGVFDILCCLLQ